VLYYFGYLPLWFGPERSHWSKHLEDDDQAQQAINQLEDDPGFRRFNMKPSTRNFLEVCNSTPNRRVMKVVFIERSGLSLKGVIRFGADVEGPPRCVHGGCSAAVIDSCLGIFATHTSWSPCLTANLTVDYRDKIPLGTTVGVECRLISTEGRKVHVSFQLYRLGSSPRCVYIDGTALFLKVLGSIVS